MRRLALPAVLLVGLLLVCWLLWTPGAAPPRRIGISLVAVSPQGQVAVGNLDGRVVIGGLEGGAAPVQIQAAGRPLQDLQFSPDGLSLVVAGRNVGLWREGQFRWLRTDQRSYGCVRFTRDGKRIVWTTGDSQVEAVEAASGQEQWHTCCTTIYGDLALTPDEEGVVTAGHEPRLWRMSDGEMLRALLPYESSFTYRPLVFAREGGRFWIGGQDGQVREIAWGTTSRAKISPAAPHYVDSIAELGQGWIAYGAAGNPVRLWRPGSGESRLWEAAAPSSNLQSNQEGDLVFGNAAGEVEVWRVQADGAGKRSKSMWAWPEPKPRPQGEAR